MRFLQRKRQVQSILVVQNLAKDYRRPERAVPDSTAEVMHVSWAGGRQGGMAQTVEDLQNLYRAAVAEPWSYEWLPISCVAILVHLVSASMLRPSGKLSAASAQLQAGLQLVDESLATERIDLQVWKIGHRSLHSLPVIIMSLLTGGGGGGGAHS